MFNFDLILLQQLIKLICAESIEWLLQLSINVLRYFFIIVVQCISRMRSPLQSSSSSSSSGHQPVGEVVIQSRNSGLSSYSSSQSYEVVRNESVGEYNQELNGIYYPVRVGNRLFFIQRRSQIRFLIDIGADRNVFPRSFIPQRVKPVADPSRNFRAANNTHISTYGTTSMKLDFGLGRNFEWNLTIADVDQPILGADFFAHYGLIVDFTNGRIIFMG
ncbi:uncharacterized protein LOC123261455 [Cotesia glomerata]|uniref:uncharacterized protein LOC123261455 n=1 Tax=Cotesia glomerata TaxID=32391 RepID=UPI001D014228|nr:uncharacterized protein LOC123261455 [Cotesia glomerata]